MQQEHSIQELLLKIKELESRLEESEQLIDAIKAGEVDAFAVNKDNKSEIFTLQSGDYAYRMMIEKSGEGALNLSDDGLIVYTNSYFHELLKLPYDKVIGSCIFQFIHPDSQAAFGKLLKKGLVGQSKGEISLAVGKKKLCVYVSLTSLHPHLPTVGMILTDLTEKKNHEQVLEKKNKELLNANTELASFAYIASHDLQEPLRKIQTFASRIIEKEEVNLSDNGKDYLSKMRHAAHRMQILIEDLLTYSRTNAVQRKFETTDLNKIVTDVKADLQEELQQKNATIEVNEMCTAAIVPFQFRQLFNNLINNSLKFSRPEQPPHIKLKSEIVKGEKLKNKKLSEDKKYCHINISDNGIGFSQKYSTKIFEVFQQLHGRSQYAGTGIGLAIVKKIVDNHNGIITATGEVNKGATFDIYLPVV